MNQGLGLGIESGKRPISDEQSRYAIDLDGTNDILSIPAYAISGGSGVSDFSITMWHNQDDDGGATPYRRKSIFGIYDDANNYWQCSHTAANTFSFKVVIGGTTIIEATAQDVTNEATAGTWMHYVISHDRSSGTTIYVNGTSITLGTDTIADTTTNIHVAEVLTLGAYSTYYAACMFNEFSIHAGTALSAAQVSAIYNRGMGGGRHNWVTGTEGTIRNGLRGLFLMGDGTEQGSGTTVYDMAGSVGNATLTNLSAGSEYSTSVP